MIWCMIAALLLLAVFALSALIAEKCLQMVVNPVRYDVDYVKALETTNGFSDCIEAYETKWQRTPFVLHCAGADISGEYMMNPGAAWGLRLRRGVWRSSAMGTP